MSTTKGPSIYRNIDNYKIDELFVDGEFAEHFEKGKNTKMIEKNKCILKYQICGDSLYYISNRKNCILLCAEITHGNGKVLSKLFGNSLQIKIFEKIFDDSYESIYWETFQQVENELVGEQEDNDDILRF